MADRLTGIGVSAGRAAGPLARMGARPQLPPPGPVTDPAQEAATARAALDAVSADLTARAGRSQDRTAASILEAAAMMAADPVLLDDVTERAQAGTHAAHAIDAVLTGHRQAMEAIGGKFAERATDIDDIRQRAVAVALGLPLPGLPEPGHPYVLAADDLAPADTAGIDPAVVLGLVTERGGPTSHTAILARALGIPAIVACPGALSVPDGTIVLVDGSAGTVGLDPDPAEVAAVRQQAAGAAAARAAGPAGPGQTSDGHPVKLMVNIGSARDLEGADADGAQGAGLFRTELLFLSRSQAPAEAEQQEMYAAVFRAARGRTVVVRTLDAGADKPLPFLGLADEPNPALGVRGLRTARRQGHLLDAQLRAVSAAAAAEKADVWVMAPMVSTAAEAADFAARVRGAGLPVAGAMVEVPAAALCAADLLASLDFLSIGTNDLSQYTLAADRMCGELSDLLDPWQPALLRLIAACGQAAQAAGKPVGVCGEAASDPALAPVLAGLGATSLSMSARSLGPVRAALARHSLAECQVLAARVLAARDPAGARAAAQPRAG
jgi:phosphotransferase system enzyme I (PtsI)